MPLFELPATIIKQLLSRGVKKIAPEVVHGGAFNEKAFATALQGLEKAAPRTVLPGAVQQSTVLKAPDLIAQKEINRRVLIDAAKKGEVTPDSVIRSTDVGYVKGIIKNSDRLPTGRDFEGNEVISASKFIPGGEIPMYGGKGGDHIVMIGKTSSLEGAGGGVNDWNIKPDTSAYDFKYIYHGKTYNYGQIKTEMLKTSPEAKAKELGIIFNGMQPWPKSTGRSDMPMFTDPVTKSTFGVQEGEDTLTNLMQMRKKFGVE